MSAAEAGEPTPMTIAAALNAILDEVFMTAKSSQNSLRANATRVRKHARCMGNPRTEIEFPDPARQARRRAPAQLTITGRPMTLWERALVAEAKPTSP